MSVPLDCSHSDPLAHSAWGRLGEEIDKPSRMIRVLLKDWGFLVWLRGRTWDRNGGGHWAKRVHEICKPLPKSRRTVHLVKEWLKQLPDHEGEMPELQEASERQFHVRPAQSHTFPVLRSSSLLAGWGWWWWWGWCCCCSWTAFQHDLQDWARHISKPELMGIIGSF